MLILRTGLPGASKTLNSLVDLVKSNDGSREHYYHNIRLVMLDFDVCNSFSGWFYGHYFPNLKSKSARTKLIKIMTRVHKEDEYVSLSDVPWLESYYEAHNPLDTWLYWVRRVYSAKQVVQMNEFIENSGGSDSVIFEKLKQFNLHFTYFDNPREWFKLPKGVIIFIDECQHFFPPRGVGAKVPEHISEFETHRHKGWDIHLVTQDPKLMDVNIRRLTGQHIHFHNAFGGERVTRYTSSKCIDPHNYFDLQASQKALVKRDKTFYGSYFSAEMHTHKFKVPKIFYLGLLCIFILILCIYVLFKVILPQPVSTSETKKSESVPETSKSFSVQKITYKDNLAPSEQKALVSFVSKLTTDVYIDGSIATYDVYGAVKYDYSFSNKLTEDIFSPHAVGFTVKQLGSCLVKLTLYDYTTFLTCDPFYRIKPVSDDSADNGDFFVAS